MPAHPPPSRHRASSSRVCAWLCGWPLLFGLLFGLLGLAVANDRAQYARELIDAYNAASPVAGDEPESFPDVLDC